MMQLRKIIAPEWRQIAGAAVLGGLSSAMAVGLLACSAWLISMASLRPPVLTLEVAIVSVRFFGLSRGPLRYLARIVEHSNALKLLSDIRIFLYRSLESNLPVHFLLFRRGELLRRLVADSEALEDLWLRLLNPWLGAVLSGTAGLGIVFFLIPKLGVAQAGLFIVALFAIPLISVFVSANADQRSEEEVVFDAIVQASDSVQESLIFGYQGAVRDQITEAQECINAIDIRSGLASGLANFVQLNLIGSSVVIAAALSATAYGEGRIAGINVAVLVLLPLVIFDGLSGLPAAFARLGNILNSAKSVESLLLDGVQAPSELAEPPLSISSIEFRQTQPLLEGITIPPFSGRAEMGRPLLIQGKSGLGKSSLVHAFLGFLPFAGEIVIDGMPSSADEGELRVAASAVLLQQDHLFATSLRENLKIGNPEATDEEMVEALRVVELDGLVETIGLDTHLGAYGHNFSGGERQRLKLARTLLRNRPIVLLDEPFEYLDFNQANRIASKVSQLCKERILIVVSHLPVELN